MDMKTTVTLKGKEYPLAYTALAAGIISEKCARPEKMGEYLQSGSRAERVQKVCWILSVLMYAGELYERAEAALEGRERERRPSLKPEDVLGLLKPKDMPKVVIALGEAIQKGLCIPDATKK